MTEKWEEEEKRMMHNIEAAVIEVIPRLIRVGARLPDEIGRTLEEELYPHNHEHLVRRKEFHLYRNNLRIDQTKKRESYRQKWQERQLFWKDCRIESAKAEFAKALDDLEHAAVVDETLESFKAKQNELLQELNAYLREWASLKPPHFSASLVSGYEVEKITPVQTKLAELHQEIKDQLKSLEVCETFEYITFFLSSLFINLDHSTATSFFIYLSFLLRPKIERTADSSSIRLSIACLFVCTQHIQSNKSSNSQMKRHPHFCVRVRSGMLSSSSGSVSVWIRSRSSAFLKWVVCTRF